MLELNKTVCGLFQLTIFIIDSSYHFYAYFRNLGEFRILYADIFQNLDDSFSNTDTGILKQNQKIKYSMKDKSKLQLVQIRASVYVLYLIIIHLWAPNGITQSTINVTLMSWLFFMPTLISIFMNMFFSYFIFLLQHNFLQANNLNYVYLTHSLLKIWSLDMPNTENVCIFQKLHTIRTQT